MYDKSRYLAAGDRTLIIEVGNEIEEAANAKIRGLSITILNNKIPGIIEIVPTYRSLMVIYDPIEIEFDALVDRIKSLEGSINESSLPEPNVIEIPTLYGGEYGPDIQFVAEHNKLSVDEVIKIHSSVEYLIYMLGFTPGFPYLGGMSKKIETPRLKTPRTKIPAGSVGIAGKQTGIYPIESPGGWQLIGRTPVRLYDPQRSEPVLLGAGDYIKFVPINENEYKDILDAENRNAYKVKIKAKDRR